MIVFAAWNAPDVRGLFSCGLGAFGRWDAYPWRGGHLVVLQAHHHSVLSRIDALHPCLRKLPGAHGVLDGRQAEHLAPMVAVRSGDTMTSLLQHAYADTGIDVLDPNHH